MEKFTKITTITGTRGIMPNITNKWITNYIDLAKEVSKWSKDPSTKVGSVIVRPDGSVASLGFNGFPKGDPDRPEDYLDRDLKLLKVVHAEVNAICFCRDVMDNYSIFTYPFAPCPNCAGQIIHKGIKEVYFPAMNQAQADRWYTKMKLALDMFDNAGVKHYAILGNGEICTETC